MISYVLVQGEIWSRGQQGCHEKAIMRALRMILENKAVQHFERFLKSGYSVILYVIRLYYLSERFIAHYHECSYTQGNGINAQRRPVNEWFR